MCKYCRNLKRIKDLEEKEYLDLIKKWKRCVHRHENLLRMTLGFVPKELQKLIIEEIERSVV